ncbi:hypothetical protein PPTG_24624 [Phytophthora nicotianae INRA-310]|uniref:RxLR effector protein n=2 Tax=Phytophthora nicotianae TaxID=4792 RepID=W2PCQ4_PHYN3|nr:hypothetical protein PPTG_24624 [Phytophthora nicotianae INRA-310]ETL46902.1 hypothetical protein L916_03295 [Phytophthora nicotianae]ETM53203.1 hypothetical protein L914_03308 [Phytophthora nicotianae]ETM98435.1 hypothetical protein PPTG_24624 [Phytophthora nicotianae INRA-310]
MNRGSVWVLYALSQIVLLNIRLHTVKIVSDSEPELQAQPGITPDAAAAAGSKPAAGGVGEEAMSASGLSGHLISEAFKNF